MGTKGSGVFAPSISPASTPRDPADISHMVAAVRKHSRVLLLGQVQSGKTQAYLNVAKRLLDEKGSFAPETVIILAGTHKDLQDQTEERATIEAKNAGLPEGSFHVFLKNKKRLADALVVAKQAREVRHPVLVIDDESDQASPNTRARKNQLEGTLQRSVVNAALVELVEEVLRPDEKGESIGRYLACTATPAATLLTPRTDILSCDAAVLLEAHDEYFGPADAVHHVKVLPEPAEGSDGFQLWSTLFVLYYFVGAALEALDAGTPSDSSPNLRQLMVHVSQQIGPQKKVLEHLKQETEGWLGFLGDPGAAGQHYHERLDEALRFFKRELASTDKPVFLERAGEVLRRLQDELVIVNSKTKHEDNVFDSKAGIVGGNMLSRGITLPGLITSGIVRALRDSTPLDAVLQWMRFCGPRKRYAKYVTILLTHDVRTAFELIVDADNDLRSQLNSSAENGVIYLPAWRRSFLLPLKKTTRTQVIGLDVRERQFDSGWTQFRNFDTDVGRCRHNIEVLEQIIATFSLEQGDDKGVYLFKTEQVQQLFAFLRKFKRPASADDKTYFEDIPDLLREETGFRLYLPGGKDIQKRSTDGSVTLQTNPAITTGRLNNVFSDQQAKEGRLRNDLVASIHFRRIQPMVPRTDLEVPGAVPDVLGAIHLPEAVAQRAFKRTVEQGNPRQNSTNGDGELL